MLKQSTQLWFSKIALSSMKMFVARQFTKGRLNNDLPFSLHMPKILKIWYQFRPLVEFFINLSTLIVSSKISTKKRVTQICHSENSVLCNSLALYQTLGLTSHRHQTFFIVKSFFIHNFTPFTQAL